MSKNAERRRPRRTYTDVIFVVLQNGPEMFRYMDVDEAKGLVRIIAGGVLPGKKACVYACMYLLYLYFLLCSSLLISSCIVGAFTNI